MRGDRAALGIRKLPVTPLCPPPAVLRLGGSAEALGGAQRSLHLPDPVLRFCLTLSHLNRALFLACDNVLWAGKTGILPGLDTDKWSQRSFRCVGRGVWIWWGICERKVGKASSGLSGEQGREVGLPSESRE